MTRSLTPLLHLTRRVQVRLEFKLADLWVGLFVSRTITLELPGYDLRYDIWVCLLPCLPIHLIVYGGSERYD